MSEEQERHAFESGLEPDVEGHGLEIGRADMGEAEEERHETDEPDVEGHAFEAGRMEENRFERHSES